MTDKLKCPFCGAELQTDNEIARLIMWRCHTPGCLLNGWHSAEIIQHLIDGKKAQDALKESARIMQGLFGAMRKSRIGTTYAKMDGQSTKMTFGDYKTEAAQWLFDNFGVFWRDATNYLTDEQKVKIASITKREK